MLDVARPVDGATRPDMEDMFTTQLRDNTIKRVQTISGVTAEAGAVFDHLLRRSHSDSSSSQTSRPTRRLVSRQRLTVITENSHNTDVRHHAGDNWTTDISRNSVDTRLSSYNRLGDVDGRPSRSSVQSGDGFLQLSRDSVDAFEHSSRTRLSSSDGLDDTQSRGLSGQQTAEAPSLASMSVELTDDISDDERKPKKIPKKKKSVFRRVRERLRATFSRTEDRNRAAHKADKYMHPNGEPNRQNWLTASFRRKRRKHQTNHGSANGSTLAADHDGSSDHGQNHSTIDKVSTYRDQQKSKGLLTNLQRRFSTMRVKRSQSRGSISSGTQLSQSGDETNILPLSQSQQKILSRYATSVQEPMPTATNSMHSRQGHHSFRATLALNIAKPMRPATDATASDSKPVVVDVEPALSSDLEERVRDWDFIDGNEQQDPPLQHATTRSFSQKSPAEKEELYERIASQLISISDSYGISTPPKSAECAASSSAVDNTHEMSIDLSAVASQMLTTGSHSYNTFQSVISEAIRGESGLQQIAFMFHLSRAAIEYAGTGTQLAIDIKNMTMRYFEQYFAPWVVEQGGWESVVESTDSELD